MSTRHWPCAFLANLPYTTDEDDLAELLSGLGLSPLRIRLAHDEHGRSKGYAHCSFTTEGERDTAIAALTGYELAGRRLAAEPARTRS